MNDDLRPEQIDVNQRHMLELVSSIVVAYLSKNEAALPELPNIIKRVHGSLKSLIETEPLLSPNDGKEVSKSASSTPPFGVDIKDSVTNDYIVCLEDGRRLKTLKRYLAGRFGLTPAEYRAKWGLPADYPMVAPAYAARRSELAKEMGLGRARRPKRRGTRRK